MHTKFHLSFALLSILPILPILVAFTHSEPLPLSIFIKPTRRLILPRCTHATITTFSILEIRTLTFTQITTTTTSLWTTTTSTYCSFASCFYGTPVTTDGVTLSYYPVIPTPSIENPVLDLKFVEEHLVGQTNLFLGVKKRGKAWEACQSLRTEGKGEGCLSWFIGFDSKDNAWICKRFNTLIFTDNLIPAPITFSTSVTMSGAALDRLCPTRTTSSSIISNKPTYIVDPPPSTVTRSGKSRMTEEATFSFGDPVPTSLAV